MSAPALANKCWPDYVVKGQVHHNEFTCSIWPFGDGQLVAGNREQQTLDRCSGRKTANDQLPLPHFLDLGKRDQRQRNVACCSTAGRPSFSTIFMAQALFAIFSIRNLN